MYNRNLEKLKVKNKIILYIITGLVVIAAVVYFTTNSENSGKTTAAQTPSKSGRKILYWRAPMNPTEIYNHPGKSKMGMDLVPVYADEGGAAGFVKIDPVVVQNMNVQTYTVIDSELSSRVITNGVLKTNETKDYIVTTRVNGWIQKLYVDYTGEKVSKGEKLMDIYSPELVAAEQELLTALSYQKSVNKSNVGDVLKSGNELVKNAERKLQLLEIPDREISRIEQTKEVKTYITLYAQYSGTVIKKDILEGQKIKAGQPLMQISNLSTLWLTADIYEYELSKIELGSNAKIRFNYFPGKVYDGRISFIYPTIDSKSRTATVRIDINNPQGRLMPEMFANVEISGRKLGVHPIIPENAVIRSGMHDLVIISLGDGKFKPQNVILGGYSNGYYQVLKGLSTGTQVVTSAQFLIDSESNLRAAVQQFVPAENNKGKGSSKSIKKMKMNDRKSDDKKPMKMKANKKEKTEALKSKSINVDIVDKNHDGKVYQCPMDFDVLSDKPGIDPKCGMKLREVTIAEAKANLIEHGFKVSSIPQKQSRKEN
jgi:membrane fusion protein, copper/silver efflux system